MLKDLPQIGVGTWLITKENVLTNVVKTAINVGYKHIDTAQIYNNETQIGKTLKSLNIFGNRRKDFYITSKIAPVNYKYNAYRSILESVQRLDLEYIDLMLLHAEFNSENNEIAYKAMMEAREDGLIRHLGVSNFSIEALQDLKEKTGEYPYCNQIILSPTLRVLDLENFCKEKGIKLIGYSIMRPYFNPSPYYENSEMTPKEKEYIDMLAKKYNKDPGQVLNRWATQIGYAVIPKSSKAKRVSSNFRIFDFKLKQDEIDEISSFNRFDSEKYRKLILKWTENIDDDKLKEGLLFEENFDAKILRNLRKSMK